jgi:uncharacterized protein with von Willebrand factor type A (vWA) domain
MERTLTRFVRALRTAGMSVSSAEAIDASRALALVGYSDRDVLKASLGIVMAKSEEDDALFEQVFDPFGQFRIFPAGQIDVTGQIQKGAGPDGDIEKGIPGHGKLFLDHRFRSLAEEAGEIAPDADPAGH